MKKKIYRIRLYALQKGVAYIKAKDKNEVLNKFLDGKIEDVDITEDGEWEMDGNIDDAIEEIR